IEARAGIAVDDARPAVERGRAEHLEQVAADAGAYARLELTPIDAEPHQSLASRGHRDLASGTAVSENLRVHALDAVDVGAEAEGRRRPRATGGAEARGATGIVEQDTHRLGEPGGRGRLHQKPGLA